MVDGPTQVASSAVGLGEISLDGALTSRTAFRLCRLTQQHLEGRPREIALNLERVADVDVIGLAALHQASRRAAEKGIPLSIRPSRALWQGLLDTRLLDEIALAVHPAVSAPATIADTPAFVHASGPTILRTPQIALRPPRWSDRSLFERWAHHPAFESMVSSDLLYRCRHLGWHSPEFTSLLLDDPTQLLFLVQPKAEPRPVGFLRLYDIQLAEQFAALEMAIADPRALRYGWGVEATQLLIAFARDVLELRRVEAKIDSSNRVSFNALRRTGFQPEGVRRSARTSGGQRRDILVFSILAEEMDAQRARGRFPYMGLWG